MTKNETITVILEAHNGFSRRMKMPAKDLPIKIKIPFMYAVRITCPVVGDRIDLDVVPHGLFVLWKKTKRTATYRLENIYQAQPILKP